MRCKICEAVVYSSKSKRRHCWSTNQQCPKCHYLGEMNRRAVKMTTLI